MLVLVWRRQLAAPCPTRPSPFCTGTPLPVGGPIVAVVGKEVKVQLPEDVQGDAAIGGRHVVVGFPEHGVEAVQGHVLTQQPVREPVDLQQPLQLLARQRTHGCWGLTYTRLAGVYHFILPTPVMQEGAPQTTS